ncbi:MAG: universal stress protein [Neptuniibacter sp.]
MGTYNKILLALDLSVESEQLKEKAKSIAEANQAELSLIHVIEPLSFAYGGDVPVDLSTIQDQLDAHAGQKLENYAKEINYPVAQQLVITGHTETEIHRVADENDVDLIIVGSHGRHGLSLLLGSTANGVLHGAHCDVLAVRVHEEQEA